MCSTITGKISKIISEYTVVINVGSDAGVRENMKFEILAPEIQITDPDSGEELGALHYVKARVKVTQVYEKFAVAESYETAISSLLPFPSYFTQRAVTKRLPIASTARVAFERNVEVGDEVKQILEEEEHTETENTQE